MMWSSSVAWSQLWLDPQPNVISMNVYSCKSSHMIKKEALIVPWSSRFVSGLPPRGGLWKKSKWPWNIIHLLPCRNPCRLYTHLGIHILRWSLKHSVKPTWTSPAFSTNESAWCVMVTGSQSPVWMWPLAESGIKHHVQVFNDNSVVAKAMNIGSTPTCPHVSGD